MPTIITHPAVALLLRRASPATLFTGALLAILPDVDVLAFPLGIPYAHPLGHRGFTHSIVFAVITSLIAARLLRVRGAWPALVACALSHPLLDALTDGGLGVALFAPFDNRRYFFPWTPIRVSPIGAGFFSARGLETLRSEILWVWLPCAVVAAIMAAIMASATRGSRPSKGRKG
ncbi:MAG TPA: metal-dependent hydrolase [Thermoanaerobaculia bacterium]|jgi:inner membrane protein